MPSVVGSWGSRNGTSRRRELASHTRHERKGESEALDRANLRNTRRPKNRRLNGIVAVG